MLKKTPKTNVVSALTARTQFGQLMRRAATKKERFLVDRRGQPSVIIMGVDDYVEAFAPEPDWLTKIRSKSKARGTDRLSESQLNRIVAEVRSASRNRLKP